LGPKLTEQIDRVLAAEDRFVQDLIDAEYDGDERQEDGGEVMRISESADDRTRERV